MLAKYMRGVTAACMITLIPGMAAAKSDAVLLECQMKKGNKAGDWIAPAYAFTMHRNGNVFVIDGVTLRFADGARAVKVSRKSNKVKLSWSLDLTLEAFPEAPILNDTAVTLRYVGSLNTDTGKIVVRAGTQLGRASTYRAAGSCVFHKA